MTVQSHPRDKVGTSLVALVAYYVPLTAISLCDIAIPGPAMAALYCAPAVVAAVAGAWLALRHTTVATPVLVPVPVRP